MSRSSKGGQRCPSPKCTWCGGRIRSEHRWNVHTEGFCTRKPAAFRRKLEEALSDPSDRRADKE